MRVSFPSTVAIQGFAGSFHALAARQYFGSEPALLYCATFREVVQHVARGTAEAGLMAIENSIAGSILPNYQLLQAAAGVGVAGEVYLRIRQHLLALPGQTLADIEEVCSHPVALQQCAGFLGSRPWRLVETTDTALSAQHLRQRQQRGVAAVAGMAAAHLHELEVLAADIHDDPDNYTRFLVLQPAAPEPVATANKASLYFHAEHRRGSLARVLACIAERGFNLSKLQSCPRPGRTWEYFFHADVEFDAPAQLAALLPDLATLTDDLRVLGAYPRGTTGI